MAKSQLTTIGGIIVILIVVGILTGTIPLGASKYDVDGDGKVNQRDIQYCLKNPMESRCDFDNDGFIFDSDDRKALANAMIDPTALGAGESCSADALSKIDKNGDCHIDDFDNLLAIDMWSTGEINDFCNLYIIDIWSKGIPLPNCVQTQVTMCSDTDDGKNIWVRGTMTVTGDSSWVGSHTDFCSGNKVYEFYCQNNDGTGFGIDCAIENMNCVDGACVDTQPVTTTPTTVATTVPTTTPTTTTPTTTTPTTTTPTTTVINCDYKDGWVDVETICSSSTYKQVNQEYRDYTSSIGCVDYSVTNTRGVSTYCPNGCSDGACLGETTSTVSTTSISTSTSTLTTSTIPAGCPIILPGALCPDADGPEDLCPVADDALGCPEVRCDLCEQPSFIVKIWNDIVAWFNSLFGGE